MNDEKTVADHLRVELIDCAETMREDENRAGEYLALLLAGEWPDKIDAALAEKQSIADALSGVVDSQIEIIKDLEKSQISKDVRRETATSLLAALASRDLKRRDEHYSQAQNMDHHMCGHDVAAKTNLTMVATAIELADELLHQLKVKKT